jgi:hypothetical protein
MKGRGPCGEINPDYLIFPVVKINKQYRNRSGNMEKLFVNVRCISKKQPHKWTSF